MGLGLQTSVFFSVTPLAVGSARLTRLAEVVTPFCNLHPDMRRSVCLLSYRISLAPRLYRRIQCHAVVFDIKQSFLIGSSIIRSRPNPLKVEKHLIIDRQAGINSHAR